MQQFGKIQLKNKICCHILIPYFTSPSACVKYGRFGEAGKKLDNLMKHNTFYCSFSKAINVVETIPTSHLTQTKDSNHCLPASNFLLKE